MSIESLASKRETIAELFLKAEDEDKNFLIRFLSKIMDVDSSNEVNDILSGKKLPSLYYDIISKKIFDPDEHPERLSRLLKMITNDNVEVLSSFKNEGFRQSIDGKKVVFDIPSKLVDLRVADLEVQVSPQDFIFERGDIYSSDLLLMQYSVQPEQDKSELNYKNVNGTLLIVLMRKSPRIFKEFKSNNYVHRFVKRTADTGLTYSPLSQIIYVEMDKCLEQLCENIDGENNKELQLLISMIADINNPKVMSAIDENKFLKDIYTDVYKMSQNKEVQAMILAEKYADADYNAMKSYARREGLEEGRAEGRAEGIAEGREEGREEGRAEGIADGIEAMILELRESGVSEDIIEKAKQSVMEKHK